MITYENEKHFLRRNIYTIFLMMGNECNLNCRYCLQHPLVEHPISHEINPDIYDFIEQVCRENINLPLDVRFWGGEPLVFLPNIKKVVNEIEYRGLPVSFSTMSNGKLVTNEVVDYFKEHNFNFAISWDGRNSIKTRGYDAFEENKDILFKIPHLSISAVLSAYAYPKEICEDFQKLDEEYYEIHDEHLGMNIDDIANTGAGNLPKDLLDLDFNKISNQIYEMCLEYFDNKLNNNFNESNYARTNYIRSIYNKVKWYYVEGDGNWHNEWCCCGNGYDTLNLGIDGMLYPCHNTSQSIGNINDGYFKYLKKLISYDTTFKHHYDNTCNECTAISYCHGGCKLISDENRSSYYCSLKKAIVLPVIHALTEMGKEL